MKTLAVVLLLLFGAAFLWQGPVVFEFFRKRVEVTTPVERATARREAEARRVADEIVKLASEMEQATGGKNDDAKPHTTPPHAQKEAHPSP